MNSNQPTCGQNVLSASNICKEAYKLIVKRISSTPAKSQTKWITDCGNYANSIKWDKSYNLPFCCTRETKLQTFQFKLLHRRIATNNYLYKIGISLTDSCTFCEQTTETLIHLFWECESVQKFWQNIQYWLIQHQVKPQDFSLNLPTCLGLVVNTKDILNFTSCTSTWQISHLLVENKENPAKFTYIFANLLKVPGNRKMFCL